MSVHLYSVKFRLKREHADYTIRFNIILIFKFTVSNLKLFPVKSKYLHVCRCLIKNFIVIIFHDLTAKILQHDIQYLMRVL